MGPDPIRPQFYTIETVGNSTAPAKLYDLEFGGWIRLDSARLIPYALGRTVDQRLVNDRTGRGGTGGNTRDTSVARGQMMDLRVRSEMLGTTVINVVRDSSVVDVMVQDTVFVVTRPHPDPARTRVDTGYFVGDRLILPVWIDMPVRAAIPFTYRVTR